MYFYAVEVNYREPDETFEHLYIAESTDEVAQATGAAKDKIHELPAHMGHAALQCKRHIDWIVDGMIREF